MNTTVAALLASPENWCQRCLAMDTDGKSLEDNLAILPGDSLKNEGTGRRVYEEICKPKYTRFCVAGAFLRAYGLETFHASAARERILTELTKLTPEGQPRLKAARFNDAPAAKFEDIVKFVQNARI